VSIEGNGNDIDGRVTVAGCKVWCSDNPIISIDNYRGRVAFLSQQYYFEVNATYHDSTYQFLHTGTQPVCVSFIGSKSAGGYAGSVSATAGSGASMNYVKNSWTGPVDATPCGLAAASGALDDLRQLGTLDLATNFPPTLPTPIRTISRDHVACAPLGLNVSKNQSTTLLKIRYSVPQSGHVKVAIYGVDGRCVQVLHDGVQKPGSYSICWGERPWTAIGTGLYLVILESMGESVSQKVAYLK
jgi:hypothetical protein